MSVSINFLELTYIQSDGFINSHKKISKSSAVTGGNELRKFQISLPFQSPGAQKAQSITDSSAPELIYLALVCVSHCFCPEIMH